MYSHGKTSALSAITMQIVKSPQKISGWKSKVAFCNSSFLLFCLFFISHFCRLLVHLNSFSGCPKKSRGERYGCHETRGMRLSVCLFVCQSSIKCGTAGDSATFERGHTHQPPKTVFKLDSQLGAIKSLWPSLIGIRLVKLKDRSHVDIVKSQ